jgi:molybdate transport system ATP-binding protein
MRSLMEERGVPVVSVTHDVEEALLLGAEVVRLEDGKVVAQGPAAEVLAAERERMLSVLQAG